MKRIECSAVVVLAALSLAAAACGNPLTTAEETQTAAAATMEAPSPTTTLAITATAQPTDTPTDPATPPAAIGTPDPATLTDTGYKAPDGRPLYAECMQAGAPLPPQIPTPAATQPPLETVDPRIDPNEGKPTPQPSDLPPFDPRTISPADTTGWTLRASACYGYSIALPPGWKVLTPFHNAGYQQGEDGTIQSEDGKATVAVGVYYTPVDYLVASRQISLSQGEYLISPLRDVAIDGQPGVEQYLSVSGESNGVYLGAVYSLRPDWYLSIGIRLAPPFDVGAAMAARAVVDSIRVQ